MTCWLEAPRPPASASRVRVGIQHHPILRSPELPDTLSSSCHHNVQTDLLSSIAKGLYGAYGFFQGILEHYCVVIPVTNVSATLWYYSGHWHFYVEPRSRYDNFYLLYQRFLTLLMSVLFNVHSHKRSKLQQPLSHQQTNRLCFNFLQMLYELWFIHI